MTTTSKETPSSSTSRKS